MDLTFSVTSGAPIATLYVAPAKKLDEGSYVKLKTKDDARVGKAVLEAGVYEYVLVLRGDAPKAGYTLAITCDDEDPITRKGKLDKKGNGGDVGIITLT